MVGKAEGGSGRLPLLGVHGRTGVAVREDRKRPVLLRGLDALDSLGIRDTEVACTAAAVKDGKRPSTS